MHFLLHPCQDFTFPDDFPQTLQGPCTKLVLSHKSIADKPSFTSSSTPSPREVDLETHNSVPIDLLAMTETGNPAKDGGSSAALPRIKMFHWSLVFQARVRLDTNRMQVGEMAGLMGLGIYACILCNWLMMIYTR